MMDIDLEEYQIELFAISGKSFTNWKMINSTSIDICTLLNDGLSYLILRKDANTIIEKIIKNGW